MFIIKAGYHMQKIQGRAFGSSNFLAFEFEAVIRSLRLTISVGICFYSLRSSYETRRIWTVNRVKRTAAKVASINFRAEEH